MKKILFYMNTIGFGGAERVIVNLANKFSDNDYNVIFITSFKVEDEYLLNNKINRFILENDNVKRYFLWKNISRIKKIRNICKKEKPDLIVSFMAEPNFRAIIATLFLGVKRLISIRNDPDKEYPNFIYRIMSKILYPLCNGCVFQTKDAQKWFSNKIQNKSRIILNQVDEKFYKVNFDGRRRNIVTVGRLEPQKNHKLLIKSFAKIADKYKDEQLIIYGDGSIKNELINFSEKLGIKERVIFKGRTKNVQDEIKDSKIFTLSSDFEGLPNVIMEAMALGLPIISTDCPCGGPRELIKNGESGILVNTNDLNAMVKAICKIMDDEYFAEKIAANAKIKSQEFESDKIFSQWSEFVEDIINN